MQDHMGKNLHWLVRRQKGQELGESLDHGLYWSFCGKGKTEQRSLGLTPVNNLGTVPSYVVPGPGMIKAEEYFTLGCMGQTKEAWLWVN